MKRLATFALLAAMTALPACNSGGGGGGGGGASAPAILAKGGGGDVGWGIANGGIIAVENPSGAGLQVLRSGSVNNVFAAPDVTPYLGSNPRTITADTEIIPALSGLIDGDTPASPATGLWVKPGVILTIRPNIDVAGYGYSMSANLSFGNGVYIEGTLKVGAWEAIIDKPLMAGTYSTNNASYLNLTAENLVVGPSGVIDLSGVDNASGTGGLGGELRGTCDGALVNRGTIDATGGDGIDGGDGGGITLQTSNGAIFNAGTLTTAGGTGTTGAGGYGYPWYTREKVLMQPGIPSPDWRDGIVLLAGQYGVFNTGTLDASGGDGGLGRDGGGILVVSCSTGPAFPAGALTSSGTLDASGGKGSNNNGGAGGRIELYVNAYDGLFLVSGALTARGGDSTLDSQAGTGGSIEIFTANSGFPGDSPTLGDSAVGAAIDASGGNGTSGGIGGPAGDVLIVKSQHPESKLLLVGYDRLDASGSDGPTVGHAGGIFLYNGYYSGGYVVPPPVLSKTGKVLARVLPPVSSDPAYGNLVNEVSLIANGSTGSNNYNGGDAGYVNLINESNDVVNSGAIDAHGGSGKYGGSGSGAGFGAAPVKPSVTPGKALFNGISYGQGVVLYASYGDLTNSGRIDASGGRAVTGTYGGGDSGTVTLEASFGDLVNRADILANGGDGVADWGGDCTRYYFSGLDMDVTVALWGATISTSGTISANGGSGGSDISTGSGGVIVLYAPDVLSCASPLSANGGSMSDCLQAGDGGEIYVAGGAVTASGGISAYGGGTPVGMGGDGGYVEVVSSAAASSVSGTPDVSGGSGETNGTVGDVWIDGVHVVGSALPPP